MASLAPAASSFHVKTTVVAALALLALVAPLAARADQSAAAADGCKVECYPNTRMILGKSAGARAGDSSACRWILRTDGKPARLCDHIKCRKVCANGVSTPIASSGAAIEESPSTNDFKFEQQLESDAAPAAPAMGAMRHAHGHKLAKAVVPGVAGGARAAAASTATTAASPSAAAPAAGKRRMAPTLAPSTAFDDNDTPPPISRFLDISPEE